MSTTKVVRYTTTSCLVHDLKKERMCFHMKSLKSNKGFTLIELVVVIAILGILAGIAIPRFMDATATARGAKIVADLRTIDSAIMVYNAKTGAFPKATSDLTTATTAANSTAILLAGWPKPTTGNAIFPCAPQTTVSVTTTAYTLSATDGTTQSRAQIGTTTADQLAAGGNFAAKSL